MAGDNGGLIHGGTNAIIVALDSIKIKMSIGLQAARDANQVDLIPSREDLDVMTVHRVHIKNQKKMGVILVILVNILIQKPRRVQVAQVVHLIPSRDPLGVLLVHRVNMVRDWGKRTVVGVRLVVINQIQHKHLLHHVLNVQLGSGQEVGVQAENGGHQRLVIFVLKARHLWPKMKNVEDVQQVNSNHLIMSHLWRVKIAV